MKAQRTVAVVTGATGGIGSAMVRRLMREGYHLFLIGRDTEKLCSLQIEERSGPGTAHIFSADVRDLRQVTNAVHVMMSVFGSPDVLITCHGAAPRIKPSLEVTDEDWQAIHEVDVLGTFHLCQAVGKIMLAQGHGCMVLVSSLHAFQSYPERAAYAAAKAAIVGMMRSLACEWAGRGVRVNCICPAQVESPRTRTVLEAQISPPRGLSPEHGPSEVERAWTAIKRQHAAEQLELMRQRSPAHRLVAPEDVAEAALFLARTPSVTGQALILDHGVSASFYYQPYPEHA